MKLSSAILIFLFWVSGHAFAEEAIWSTHSRSWVSLEDVARQSRPGDIFVFGETHATKETAADPQTKIHQDNQVRFLEQLRQSVDEDFANISVGMEFLNYPKQSLVDQFRAGLIGEADFLKQVGWGGNPFESYRRQILFAGGGRTVALNIPGSIAGQVAMAGPQSLSEAQRALLPPVWERGNAAYYRRFKEAMKDHATAEEIENYFWAQSLWDDTMAWQALLSQSANPKDILVIIVGSFHVQYGGGLPHELRRLGSFPVKTLLQLEVPDWKEETLKAAVEADPVEGEQADYLWVRRVPAL